MPEHLISFIITVVVILLVLCIVASNVRVVQQSRAFVVERLGAYQTTWGVGVHIKVPFIDRVAKRGEPEGAGH